MMTPNTHSDDIPDIPTFLVLTREERRVVWIKHPPRALSDLLALQEGREDQATVDLRRAEADEAKRAELATKRKREREKKAIYSAEAERLASREGQVYLPSFDLWVPISAKGRKRLRSEMPTPKHLETLNLLLKGKLH